MKKKVSGAGIVAIMAIFFLVLSTAGVTPAINAFIAAFPNIPITTIILVSTLPSLLIVPSSIFAGSIVGKSVKYKTLAIIGILLIFVGGVAPSFMSDWSMILIMRAIFGIGVGFISPLANGILFAMFEGQQQAKLLGLGTIMMNSVGPIFLQLTTGYFTDMSWKYAFYPYAIAIVSLILVLLFLPEPEKVVIPSGAEKTKVKLQGILWVIIILFGIFFMQLYPLFLGISTLMAIRNWGGAGISAILLTFFTASGIIGGTIFVPILKACKRFLVPIATLMMAVGYALVIYGTNIILVGAGMILLGTGWGLLLPTAFAIIGTRATPQSTALASSLAVASLSLFGFLSTYFIALVAKSTGDAIVAPMITGMIIFAVAGLILLFLNPFPKAENTIE